MSRPSGPLSGRRHDQRTTPSSNIAYEHPHILTGPSMLTTDGSEPTTPGHDPENASHLLGTRVASPPITQYAPRSTQSPAHVPECPKMSHVAHVARITELTASTATTCPLSRPRPLWDIRDIEPAPWLRPPLHARAAIPSPAPGSVPARSGNQQSTPSRPARMAGCNKVHQNAALAPNARSASRVPGRAESMAGSGLTHAFGPRPTLDPVAERLTSPRTGSGAAAGPPVRVPAACAEFVFSVGDLGDARY